ncbi:MAG: hypothetical protein RDV48_26375 [Candidatus Eremiobacteraeota bacterium]|nr:hypothetical protein [Candidatus Eremiobacteraeota bacterium]
MIDEIRTGLQGTNYISGVYGKELGAAGEKKGAEAQAPAEPGDRFAADEGKDMGLYNPKMFQDLKSDEAKEAGKTEKTGEVSLKKAQDEFFEVIKEAKENYGAKPIMEEHFDKVREANTGEGQGAQGGGKQAAGSMPPHIQVATSLMNETRFPADLQAKFKEKGTQLLQAWEKESQGKGAQGAGNEQPAAAAAAVDKKPQ